MYYKLVIPAICAIFVNIPYQISAKEWWNGEFVYEGSSDCDNDSYNKYGNREVKRWEGLCNITKKENITGIDAVRLEMMCAYEDAEPVKETELLVRLDDNSIARHPNFRVMNRCEALKPVERCDHNDRIYRSAQRNVQHPERYQELQFNDGFTEGKATITEYRDGKAIWRSTGEHVCSNGAVICRLSFPVMSGESTATPYEALTDKNGEYKTIVAPAFAENVFLAEKYGTLKEKSYDGLVAEFLEGFAPTDDDILLPQNVYEFAGCTQGSE